MTREELQEKTADIAAYLELMRIGGASKTEIIMAAAIGLYSVLSHAGWAKDGNPHFVTGHIAEAFKEFRRGEK